MAVIMKAKRTMKYSSLRKELEVNVIHKNLFRIGKAE